MLPMLVELVTSFALLFDPPADQLALTIAGATLALAAWVLTIAGAAPAHRDLGDGTDVSVQRRLIRVGLIRTLAWSAHGAVVIALLAVRL